MSEIVVGIVVGIISGTLSSLLTAFFIGLFGKGILLIHREEFEHMREQFLRKGRQLDRVIPGGRWKYEQEGGKAVICRTWWGKPREVWLRKEVGDGDLLMWKPPGCLAAQRQGNV